MNYWDECITEAFEDCGITATQEQINIVVMWVEGAHENFSLATGLDVANSNFKAAEKNAAEKALNDLREQLTSQELESEKQTQRLKEQFQRRQYALQDKIRELQADD